MSVWSCRLGVFSVLPCQLFQPQIPRTRRNKEKYDRTPRTSSGCLLKTLRALTNPVDVFMPAQRRRPTCVSTLLWLLKGQPIFLDAIDEVGNWFVVILSVDKCASEGRMSIASWRLNNRWMYKSGRHDGLPNIINNVEYFNSWDRIRIVGSS